MKKFYFILFLFTSLFSIGQTVDIIVFAENGEKFLLFINSIQQNDEPQANVKAEDLEGQSFMLRIKFEDANIPILKKNIWIEDSDVVLTAVVKQNKKGKYVLKYMGETKKRPETANNNSDIEEIGYDAPTDGNSSSYGNSTETVETTTTTVTTDRVEGEQILMTDDEFSMNISANESNGGNGEHVNISFSINDGGNNTGANTGITTTTTTTTTTTITTTSSSNINHGEEIDAEEMPMNSGIINSRCPRPMLQAEFNDALKSLKNKSFEDSKLTTAKQICKANCMTSEQIRDINKEFSFEDSRIEFAKFAYKYVFDPTTYYKVNDSFQFEMSIDELNEFIENN